MTDLDLGDLNVVAIPAQPKLISQPSSKRKKNNKYERRRQKATRAKQKQSHSEEQRTSRRSPESDKDSDTRRLRQEKEGHDGSPVDDSTRTSHKADSAHVTEKERPPHASTDDDCPKINAAVKQSPAVEIPVIPVATSVKTTRRQRPVPEQLTGNKESNRTQQPCPSRHNASSAAPMMTTTTTKGNIENNEEMRARYMAEFHARPGELDRRSGARSAAAVVLSKESTHLFDDAAGKNDWESLGIHPRLIQTIKSSQFGFLHDRPTTIQCRTIHVFRQQEARIMDAEQQHSGSSTSDSKTARANKTLHRNVLLHSETGSGKTLAYVLPILQSLAYGNCTVRDDDGLKQKQHQHRQSRSDMGCRCIILCPTRELANQTLLVLERLCRANFAGWIVPGGLLGGDSRNSEKSRLRKGLGIIVATPGRLLDHLQKTTSLAMHLKGKLQWLVLDEADRLLDMGLGDQVCQIVQWIRANEASRAATQPWWRTVLVSATVTPSVQALAKERMLCGNQEWVWVKGDDGNKSKKGTTSQVTESARESIESGVAPEPSKRGSAGSDSFAHSTPHQLQQFHLTVTAKLRLSTLVAFLVQRIAKSERIVVFMGTCASVDYHHQLFSTMEESLWDADETDNRESGGNSDGKEAGGITTKESGLFGGKAQLFKLHGSVPHGRRCQTMKELSTRPGAAILLTTDVAARGLNLEGIDWIVQYDPPCEISDYVHRVGRVARAGKAGHSLLFLLPSERMYLEVLEAKGILNLTALSLSSVLNQAASICRNWTQAGAKQHGSKKSKEASSMSNSFHGEYFASEVLYRLEECVLQDDEHTRKAWKDKVAAASKQQRKRTLTPGSHGGKDGKNKEGQLLTMARDAFLSFLRAYPTKKEPAARAIFSSRALHLGHIAKSFALKEPPKSVISKQKTKRHQIQEEARDEQANLPRSLEFGDAQVDVNEVLASTTWNHHDTSDNEVDDLQHRSRKRQKVQQNVKAMNAKALLLANAAKMESNLMDAM
jgi:ATP-dependent RNA helicase DDX31/DBP7